MTTNLPYRFEIEQDANGWCVARYRVADGQRHVIALEADKERAQVWLHGYLAGRHSATDEHGNDSGPGQDPYKS